MDWKVLAQNVICDTFTDSLCPVSFIIGHKIQFAIIIYQKQDGNIKIDVRLEEETVWLTQVQLCELFGNSEQFNWKALVG